MIDIDQLNTRLGNNAAIVEKILGIFTAQYGNQDAVFDSAVSSGNTEEIYHLAHSLKGALANMCADDDAAAAAEIESAARGGAVPDAALVADMEQRIKAINEQIHSHLA
jgi:HPt (histidine-containing phosphotransfer) domain-containing protein